MVTVIARNTWCW